jgi:FKBP-type peptidyl-prolyl cis-trans isomerase 2
LFNLLPKWLHAFAAEYLMTACRKCGHSASKSDIPKNVEPYVGMELDVCQNDGKVFPSKVAGVSEDSVTLDGNHPLAGKDVIFDIEFVEIL